MADERPEKKDRRDLLILLLIVLLAFLCMIFMGGLATQLAPQWMLDTNMNSGIDPDDYYTPEINSIAPINEEILTQRVNENYLTPGAQQPTPISPNATPTPVSLRTRVPSPTAVRTGVATVTNVFTPRPTSTLQIPPSPTSVLPATITPKPPTKTPKPTSSAPSADLSITKTDGKSTYTPGMNVTYTIRVSNAGPDDVTGAMVSDSFPQKLAAVQWTCAGTGGGSCTASGNHVINDTIDLPVGATVAYTVTAKAKSSATGNLRNTATVAPPAGITDPNGGNNSATDRDTPVYIADLSITKTDGVDNYTPGGKVTYIIQVSNVGPSNVTGATVSDNFVQKIASTSWTCVANGGFCTPSGSGNISDTINLPVGGTLTYTVIANINGGATGPLNNTASVAVPAGVTDPNGGNNSATDTDTQATSADLGITKTADVSSYVPGDPITYTIQVSNAGPHDVSGATVIDTFPAEVSNPLPSWTCVASGVASCTASGSGNINDTIDLPVGETVTYTVDVTVALDATGNIVNTASVSPPAGVTDSNNLNDSATVTTPPEVCTIVANNATIPDGGCIMIRPSPGLYGNLYTITNNDLADNLVLYWNGPPANQTPPGTCLLFRQITLVPGLPNQIAVAELFNNTILIFGNTSGHTINISILETVSPTAICN